MKTDTHENLAAGGRWEGGASAETWLKCLLCSGWIGVEILRAVLERVIRITPRRLSQHFKLNTHHNPHLIAITNHISQRNECIKIFLPICKTYRQSTDQMLRYLKMYMVGILAQNQPVESLSWLQLNKSWVCCVFCLSHLSSKIVHAVDRVLVEEVDTVQAQQVLTSGTLSFSLFHRQCF